MDYLTKKQMDLLDLSSIPETRRNQIIELKNSLNLND